MKFILGKKKEMIQIFNEASGKMVPVTMIFCESSYVSQIKTSEKDGYSAVQIAFGKKKHVSKPQAGHFKLLPVNWKSKEFRVSKDESAKFTIGDKLTVSSFEVGDVVDVTGVSKGHGFAGVVKRYHFSGSPASHGHKDQLRMPGSIGSAGIERVFKGLRMGGHMGDRQITTKGITIEKIDTEANVMYVRGGIPGAINGFVYLFGKGEMTIEKSETKTTGKQDDTTSNTPKNQEVKTKEVVNV